MPVANPYAAGSELVANAFATKRRQVILSNAAPVPSTELLCSGMPHLFFWISQDPGTLGALVTPQFVMRAGTGVGAPVDEWLNLQPQQSIPPGGIPIIIREHFPAVKVRLMFEINPAAPNVATPIQYVIACSA